MKKGYFFTLDAFIAIAVMITGVVTVLYSFSSTPSSAPVLLLSQDVINVLSSTKVSELDSPLVQQFIAAGLINDINISLLDQAGLFYFRGQLANATSLVGNATAMLVPNQYGYTVLIESTAIYSRDILQDQQRLLISSRKLIFGAMNKTTLWGPYQAEVRIWQ